MSPFVCSQTFGMVNCMEEIFKYSFTVYHPDHKNVARFTTIDEDENIPVCSVYIMAATLVWSFIFMKIPGVSTNRVNSWRPNRVSIRQ